MTLDHAKAMTHHLGRLLGTTRGANAHSTFDAMHRGLDETAQKRKVVEHVEAMRDNSYLRTNEDGKALLAFVDELRVELGMVG